jgi:hypothetical protein
MKKAERAVQSQESIRDLTLIEAHGLAKETLEKGNTLKPYNSWMGIGINEKTYPEKMIRSYIRWGSEHSKKFLVVIADDPQIINKTVVFSETAEDAWSKIGPPTKAREKAAHIKTNLTQWLQDRRISNVEIKNWQEALGAEAAQEISVLQGPLTLMFNSKKGIVPELLKILPQQAPRLFERIQGKSPNENDFWNRSFLASFYALAEIDMIFALAQQGYPIKIGPVGERAYDEFAERMRRGEFRTSGLKRSKKPIGSVLLRFQDN